MDLSSLKALKPLTTLDSQKETEILVVGAGYSGIMLSSMLKDRGFNVLLVDSLLESEIEVFSRLEVLASYYSDFIEEYREILSQYDLKIHKATILKTEKKEKWIAKTEFEITAERVFICTGCCDKRAFPCGIFGTRPAGLFSLQNALELLSKGFKIGNRVLLLGKFEILKVVEELLKSLGYECEVADGEAEVHGRERVESVFVEGEKFSCDTLIYFCGREEFNPFKLEGTKAGNINAKTYDYGKVRKNVVEVISALELED